MAHMWIGADWPLLERLILLTEMVSSKLTMVSEVRGLAALLGEMRQLEDRLGLSEKGRRDLRWTFEAAPSSSDQSADLLSTPTKNSERSAQVLRLRLRGSENEPAP